MRGSRSACARNALPVRGRRDPCAPRRPTADAVRLRNILVHGYLDIDYGRLFDELAWIEQTEEFAAAIEHWLEQNVDQA